MQGILKNLNRVLRDALYCAVCFGNPKSAMSKGVVAGVIFLVVVIGAVLLGIVCVGLVWARRERVLQQSK